VLDALCRVIHSIARSAAGCESGTAAGTRPVVVDLTPASQQMNFYVLIGHGGKASVLSVTLDKATQDDLTAMFKRLADPIVDGDHVAFDPGYRADEGKIVTISSYALPAVLSVLETATVAANLPAVAEADIIDGAVRGVIGVE